jgi:2,4-dienoyl-CoA reductase-like NADH-dependent reductase (Old Yellow Enzyme family)
MSVLFQSTAIGGMRLRNRFVRSATHDYLGHPDGTISKQELDLYRDLAVGGVGLIVTGHAYVEHPLGRASVNQNGIYDDRFIEGYRRLVETVHVEGAALVLQISHAGRQTPQDWPADQVPVAPSAVREGQTGRTPRALTEEEIWSLIDSYAAAMGRAQAAGCDGVQLHVAHGYLLSAFLSPYTNRRTDAWGDSLENRCRILREILIRGRRAVGKAYPVLVKINSTDGFAGEGCLTPDDVVATCRKLVEWGVDAIEVSGGHREAKGVMSRPRVLAPEQEAYFAPAARAVKGAVDVPVILVGGLRSLAVMEGVVTGGAADLVALSRPFVFEPDLVNRLREGNAKAACASCNACFNPAGLRCRRPDTSPAAMCAV